MTPSVVLSPVSPLAGRSVFVSGGTGSFGHAFVRRALDDGARRVVVFSRGEAKQAAMRAAFNDDRMRFAIGDVRDADRVSDACRGVDVVVHAAALKRVEVCEADPSEAYKTNILGTEHMARACVERGVRRAVFLSTDKAAAPNTVYGSTKHTAEGLWGGWNNYAAGTGTRFASTRYGNVAQSTGSVIPLWRAQSASGVVSITDRAMTRFFMSMDDAVALVLVALTDLRTGSIYVPKLGRARIIDLASAVAPDCEIREIGVRPGEKLHETLITEDEARLTYDAGSHYVIEPASRPWGDELPISGHRVPEGFVYRSDTVDTLSDAALRRLVA